MKGEGDLSQGCQQFLDQIARSFDYLFDRHGFKVIHSKDVWNGERCLVILESADCRLRFIYDRGTVEAAVGSLDAPAGWSDCDESVIQWYALRSVIDFVQGHGKRSPDELRKLGLALFAMSTDEHLADLSGLLQPVCETVFQLFRKGVASERRQALDTFYSPVSPS